MKLPHLFKHSGGGSDNSSSANTESNGLAVKKAGSSSSSKKQQLQHSRSNSSSSTTTLSTIAERRTATLSNSLRSRGGGGGGEKESKTKINKSKVKIILHELHHLPEGVNSVSLNFGFNEYQFQTESEMVKSHSTSTCVLNYDAEFTIKSRGMFIFKIKCNKNKTLGYAALDVLEVTDDEAQVHKLPCYAKKGHAKQASKAKLPGTNLSTLPIILSLKASGIIDFFESPISRGSTIKRSISSANLSKIKIFGRSKSHDGEDSDVSPAFDLHSVQKLNFQNSLPLESPQKFDTITEASPSKERLSTFKVEDANTSQISDHPDKHKGGNQLHAADEQKNIPKLENTCHLVDDVLIDKHIEQDDAKPNVYPHTDHFARDDIFSNPWWSNRGSASVASASNLASISQFETEIPSSNICRACEEAYYNKILKYEKMIKDLKSQNYSLENDMIRLTNKLLDIGNEILEEEELGIEKRK